MAEALRVRRGDRVSALLIGRLGSACSPAGRAGSGAELALGVLMHDPDVLLEDPWETSQDNIPLVGRHSFLGVIKIKIVDKVVLSAHGLGEVVGDIDRSGGSRHCD